MIPASLSSTENSALLGSALETTRYFRKWVGIALLIGIVAGLGALLVSTAIHYAILLFVVGNNTIYANQTGYAGSSSWLSESRAMSWGY